MRAAFQLRARFFGGRGRADRADRGFCDTLERASDAVWPSSIRPRAARRKRLRHHRRIFAGARVLDLAVRGRLCIGCREQERGCAALEIAGEKVRRAIGRGSRVSRRIDEAGRLSDHAFDYVILSQTCRNAAAARVLRESWRVGAGHRGLPNFGHWGCGFPCGERPRATHKAVSLPMVRLAEHSLLTVRISSTAR